MDIQKALQELAQRIKQQVIENLRGEAGVNPKTGRNTLKGGKLEKSIDVKVVGDDMLVFQIADYYTYVVGGRRPGWGTPPPHGFVEGVTRWVRSKRIRFKGMTENQTIWACVRSIVKHGIAPKPFIGNGYYNDDPAFVLPFLDEFFDQWSDEMFQLIMEEVNKFFNK